MADNVPEPDHAAEHVERFRNWAPIPGTQVGVIIGKFFRLWRNVGGGGVSNFDSAGRLITYLPQEWRNWARTLVNEMERVDEHGNRSLDFQVFTHTLLTRWLYPPENQPPADLEAPAAPMPAPPEEGDLLVFPLPLEPIDPLIRVGHPPVRDPSPPRSPQPPSPPTPPLPNPTPAIDIPSPVRYKHTARISVANYPREKFRFHIPDHYTGPLSPHDSDSSHSSFDDDGSDGIGGDYDSGYEDTGCAWPFPLSHS